MKFVKQSVEIKYSVIKDLETGIEVLFIDLLAAIDNKDEYREYLLNYRENDRVVFTQNNISPFHSLTAQNTIVTLSENLAKILTVLSKSNLPPLDKQQKTDALRNIKNIKLKPIGKDEKNAYQVIICKNKTAVNYAEKMHWFDRTFIFFGGIATFLALTDIMINALDVLNSIFSLPFIVIVGVAIFFAGWEDSLVTNNAKLQRLACSLRRAFRGESFVHRNNFKFDLHQVWNSFLGIVLVLIAIGLQAMITFSRPAKMYKSIEDLVLQHNLTDFINMFNSLTKMAFVLVLTGKGVDSGQSKEIGAWFKISPSYEINFIKHQKGSNEFKWKNIYRDDDPATIEMAVKTRRFEYIPSKLSRSTSVSLLPSLVIDNNDILVLRDSKTCVAK